MTVGRGQSSPTGTLRISSTTTCGRLFILPFRWDFLATYPDLAVDMTVEDRYLDRINEAVDVAVRVVPVADSGMIASKLGESERVIEASPDYLRRKGEPQRLEELREHECVLHSLQPAFREWELSTASGVGRVTVKGRFSATTSSAIGEAALAGLGIAVVTLWSARDAIEQERLRILLPGCRPTPYEVNAV